jgi:hypothetical protein
VRTSIGGVVLLPVRAHLFAAALCNCPVSDPFVRIAKGEMRNTQKLCDLRVALRLHPFMAVIFWGAVDHITKLLYHYMSSFSIHLTAVMSSERVR